MLLIMLIGNRISAFDLFLALTYLVTVIALVCNAGYVLNELFDVEEDKKKRKVERDHAPRRSAYVVGTSREHRRFPIGFLSMDSRDALILTLCALLLSFAYSVPPLRLKERGWLGVLADAMAAHVYPALLCLLIAAPRAPYGLSKPLAVTVMLWSLAFGLRGFLTHLVLDDELDRDSGLRTVVHDRLGWRDIRHRA